jgi:hypothetical protein
MAIRHEMMRVARVRGARLVFCFTVCWMVTATTVYAVIVVGDDMYCKLTGGCGNGDTKTVSGADGCSNTAYGKGCTGNCVYCSGANASNGYCKGRRGSSCNIDTAQTRVPCGIENAVGCTGSNGPSGCCPKAGGTAGQACAMDWCAS